jgi:transposase
VLNLNKVKVYLKPGATDLRKSILGLSVLVESEMGEDLLSGSIFGFSNRNRKLIKLLYWDQNGFCLWMKRLEKDQFQWPKKESQSIQVTQRELNWLLDGLDLKQKAHKKLPYTEVS